jgi:hypothetical protein
MADKGRLTVQQRMRTVLFFCRNKKFVEMQRGFRAHFGMQWASAPKNIHRLHQQFQQDGTVWEKKRGCATSVYSPQKIEAVKSSHSKKPRKINPEGCGRIKNIQTISAANFAQ